MVQRHQGWSGYGRATLYSSEYGRVAPAWLKICHKRALNGDTDIMEALRKSGGLGPFSLDYMSLILAI